MYLNYIDITLPFTFILLLKAVCKCLIYEATLSAMFTILQKFALFISNSFGKKSISDNLNAAEKPLEVFSNCYVCEIKSALYWFIKPLNQMFLFEFSITKYFMISIKTFVVSNISYYQQMAKYIGKVGV